ncbi:hypothetical protein BRADI_1g53652v3 [Brachypodium distachyon]|uniref:Uncharacterized protein n=1 Tax=Brachypodium distachyon TaxID=15368 RepID=A0A2K2DR95_BRADI|nr:hypothetical protein BRADI_1g53652v3 [Brachypodium distachyon]
MNKHPLLSLPEQIRMGISISYCKFLFIYFSTQVMNGSISSLTCYFRSSFAPSLGIVNNIEDKAKRGIHVGTMQIPLPFRRHSLMIQLEISPVHERASFDRDCQPSAGHVRMLWVFTAHRRERSPDAGCDPPRLGRPRTPATFENARRIIPALRMPHAGALDLLPPRSGALTGCRL